MGYQGQLTQVEVHPQRTQNSHPVDGALVVLVHSGYSQNRGPRMRV